MSRAKLFNMIKSRGEHPVGRNPFDLSNRHVYTQKVAKIMPVKALHTMPDDYFDVSMSEFSQNNIPMNTAAFLSGKKELLAYFVPYNSIWHNYNQYQATREDPDSAALKVKGISYEPRFALSMLYFRALYFTIGSWMYESYSKLRAPWRWYQTFRHSSSSSAWTDFLNEYGDHASLQDLIKFMKENHYASSAQNDWEHFCRMSANEIANWNFDSFGGRSLNFPFAVAHDCYEHAIEHDFNLTYGDTILDMFGTPIWSDWISKLDMLRYGNLVPLLSKLRTNLDSRVDAILAGLFTSEISPSVFNIDGVGYDVFLGYVTSPDINDETIHHYYLDFVNDVIEKLTAFSKRSSSGDFTEDEYVNVYALYSYNKCFYDYMRNVYYDTNYSVYNYNCDFVDCTDFESSIITERYLPCRFYHLESHQWKKDLFTGVLPSNQLGAVSQVSVEIPSLVSSGTTSGVLYPSPDDFHSKAYNSYGIIQDNVNHPLSVQDGNVLADSKGSVQIRTDHTHNLVVSTDSSSASFDVLALKRAEALQQYAQDLMRAGNRTHDIFNQIYGVTPKSQLDETPYFIDVASSDININPIISTAATGNEVNGRLGDIAARVTISTSNPLSFKFSTKDFGVVLFLSYIIPDSMYNSYNLDPCVTHLDPESHGLPYFQNLGLQPIIGSWLNNLKGEVVRNRICGYAPPYIERKTDIDLVHGILVDTYLPKVTETGRDDEYNGELSHWVVARTDMQQEDTVSLRNFYIDPRIVDNVFRFSADSTPSTDHFLTYASIQIKCVRALSELGLPRF